MSDINVLRGGNMAFNSGAVTASGASAQITVVTAVVHCEEGKFGTAVAAEAKTLAFVTTKGVAATDTTGYATDTPAILHGGASTHADAPADNDGQACILVHCADAAGATKTVMSEKVQLDAAGNLMSAIHFPDIPKTLTPFCYQVLKAGLTAGDITPGTSNWNATGHTNTVVNIAHLPKRAYFA